MATDTDTNADRDRDEDRDRDRLSLTISVAGTPTDVAVNQEARLQTVVAKALEQTHNVGRPPEDWELRDIQGNLLDLHREIEGFHFPPKTVLFLSLKAGVGG